MIPITRPYLPPLEEYERLLERIWQTRMLSNFSEFATQLEELTARRLGVGTRVVSSGDIGLVVAIAALGIPEGSSAVLPSFTFNSTVNAVIWNRLRPVFVDIIPGPTTSTPRMRSRRAERPAPNCSLERTYLVLLATSKVLALLRIRLEHDSSSMLHMRTDQNTTDDR